MWQGAGDEGWFDLTKSDANGQFSFALKAGNGEQILKSEHYNTRLQSLSLNRRIGGLEIDAEVQDEPLTISVVLCHTDL